MFYTLRQRAAASTDTDVKKPNGSQNNCPEPERNI